MGMAASQARLLGLTARKTNIEYQGQQINQQRTSLANQSASYYNNLLSLGVPTPPTSDAYSTIQYSFQESTGSKAATINQLTKDANGTYTVLYSYPVTNSQLVKSSEASKYSVVNSEGTYKLNGVELTEYDGTQTAFTDTYEALKAKTGNDSTVMYYVNVGTEAAAKYVYFAQSDLENPDSSSKVYGYDYQDVETYVEDSRLNCTITRDSSNRLVSFNDGSTNFAVTSKTVTDDLALNDAEQEYSYQTYLYNQELNNLNASIEVIQCQDKKLELKLKQIDTEQSAISTELDSVKSVIKKNTEDSFKTFA